VPEGRPAPLLFDIKIPGDPRLAGAIRDLSQHAAEFAGLSATDAADITTALDAEFGRAVTSLAGGGGGLEIRFRTEGQTFEITLLYHDNERRLTRPLPVR
jgi:hypothetical protein